MEKVRLDVLFGHIKILSPTHIDKTGQIPDTIVETYDRDGVLVDTKKVPPSVRMVYK